jgi:hypothetical protein
VSDPLFDDEPLHQHGENGVARVADHFLAATPATTARSNLFCHFSVSKIVV